VPQTQSARIAVVLGKVWGDPVSEEHAWTSTLADTGSRYLSRHWNRRRNRSTGLQRQCWQQALSAAVAVDSRHGVGAARCPRRSISQEARTTRQEAEMRPRRSGGGASADCARGGASASLETGLAGHPIVRALTTVYTRANAVFASRNWLFAARRPQRLFRRAACFSRSCCKGASALQTPPRHWIGNAVRYAASKTAAGCRCSAGSCSRERHTRARRRRSGKALQVRPHDVP
jgi:hypothetical protein